MKWFVLFLLYSGLSQAITEAELIDKYGKRRIVDFISQQTAGKITIFFNDEIATVHSPSMDYITPYTIKVDFKKINTSANKLDSIFTHIKNIKQQKIAEENRWLIEAKKDANTLSKPMGKEHDQQDSTVTHNPVCAIPLNEVTHDLKLHYEDQYPNSPQLQEKFIDESIGSYNELCHEKLNNISITLLKKRIDRFYPHFSLIKMFYRRDLTAYRKLNNY